MRGIREKRRIVYNVEVSQISTVKLALQKFIAFRLSGNKLEIIFEIHDNCSTEEFLKALRNIIMDLRKLKDTFDEAAFMASLR